ncbi:hypothetical protein HPB48_008419 [Haemaphysalis longicornis]|uniref:Uncharacterized protein n=1 Tax=Haemaphysalis longicornis TaxID=44386 RepID=A0A9J6H1M1_HAELO|nr:hypothetical protein HPB48_008419 [Haemaphysalis longicornis]
MSSPSDEVDNVVVNPGKPRLPNGSSCAPRLCRATALTGAGFLALIGVSLLLLFLAASPERPGLTPPDFCCRVEAEALVPLLNTSVDPCQDFYTYVCSMSAWTRYTSSVFWSTAVGWKYTDIIQRAQLHTAAGRFQMRLERSYQKHVRNAGRVSQYVSAILKTGRVSTAMSAPKMARFLVEMSMKYLTSALISMNVSVDNSGTKVLKLEGHTDCFLLVQQDQVASALGAFNAALNTSVAIEELLSLDRHLTALPFWDDPRLERTNVANSPFSVLPDDEWAALVKEYVLAIEPSVDTKIEAKVEKLDAMFYAMLSAPNQATAAAYLTVCAAVRLDDYMKRTVVEQSVFHKNNCNTLHFCELEDAFKAEVVSSAAKDAHVSGLLRRIRDQISADVAFSRTVAPDAMRSALAALHRVKLMLPAEIAVLDLAVPEALPSASFASNLFAARSYRFSVLTTKVRRGIPDNDALSVPAVQRIGEILLVPASIYLLTRQFEIIENSILDLATIGFGMALQLWGLLLDSEEWSNVAIKSITHVYQCLQNAYAEYTGQDKALVKKLIQMTLALATTTRSFDEGTWFASYNVASMNLSEAKLFYMIWTYTQCHVQKQDIRDLGFNIVLRHLPTFGKAFGCGDDSNDSFPTPCTGVWQRRMAHLRFQDNHSLSF